MPHVTVGHRRMTNVPVGGGGEYIHGIRKNKDLGIEEVAHPTPASADYDFSPVKPLRYTPGLKCDAHLESLRPSRDPKNPPIQVHNDIKTCHTNSIYITVSRTLCLLNILTVLYLATRVVINGGRN